MAARGRQRDAKVGRDALRAEATEHEQQHVDLARGEVARQHTGHDAGGRRVHEARRAVNRSQFQNKVSAAMQAMQRRQHGRAGTVADDQSISAVDGPGSRRVGWRAAIWEGRGSAVSEGRRHAEPPAQGLAPVLGERATR